MKRPYIIILFIISASCTSVYQPTSVVTPLLEEKGDFEVQTTFRMGDMLSDVRSLPDGGTVNIGMAYAFTGKYAGILNFEYQDEYFRRSPTNESTESELRKGWVGELFLGRYFSQPKFSNTAIFLGIGKGFRDIDFEEYWFWNTATYKSDYIKSSLLFQHSFREKWRREDERLLFTLFGRLSYVHNYNIEFYSSNDYYLIEHQRFDNFFTLEPGMSLSLIYGWLAPFLQVNLSLCPLNDPQNNDYATNGHISLGMRVNFHSNK